MNKKLVTIIISTILVLLGIYLLYYFLNTGTLVLTSETKPFSLTVDNKKYGEKNSYSLRLKQGNHKIIAEKGGYSRFEANVEVKKLQKTEVNIKFIPLDKSEEIDISALGQEVLFPSLSEDGKTLRYLTNKETSFAEYNLETGSVKPVTPQYFSRIEDVLWSPSGAKAIITVRNNHNVLPKIGSPLYDAGSPENTLTKWVYDFSTHKTYKLSPNISNISWTNDENSIIYSYRNSNSTFSLYKTTVFSQSYEKLADFSADFSPVWANETTILYFSATEMGRINIGEKKAEKIKSGAYRDIKTNGNSVLLLKKEGTDNNLFLSDLNNVEKEESLGLTVSSKNKYCFIDANNALVAQQESSSGNKITNDSIVRVSLENLSKTFFNDKNNKIYGITSVLSSKNSGIIVAEGRLYKFTIN